MSNRDATGEVRTPSETSKSKQLLRDCEQTPTKVLTELDSALQSIIDKPNTKRWDGQLECPSEPAAKVLLYTVRFVSRDVAAFLKSGVTDKASYKVLLEAMRDNMNMAGMNLQPEDAEVLDSMQAKLRIISKELTGEELEEC